MDQNLTVHARAELNRINLTPASGKGSAMMPKSLSGLCSALLHAIALVCGALSIYFFLGPAIELVMVALVMLVAAIVDEHKVAHY